MSTILFSSQQPKGKDFKRHCCNVLFPHVQQQLTEKMKEEHRQAIEEKDAALALRHNQIEALEFTNKEERQANQQEILKLIEETDDLIANRHVARRGCFDNMLRFIKKNSKEVYPYYVIQFQYRQLEKRRQWFKLCYPNMEVTDECDDPNAIHRWCRFKQEVIKKPNYYKNHFSMTEEKRALLETALDVNI